MENKKKPLKLAIFVWKFPTQANTYVVAEMLNLVKFHKNFLIYSLDKPSDTTLKMFENDLIDLNDKIVYVGGKKGECPIKWSRGTNKSIAIHENRRRHQINAMKTINEVHNAEQRCYEASESVVSRVASHMKQNNITHIYSPFGNMTAEFSLFINRITGIPFSYSVHAYDLFQTYFYKKLKSEKVSYVFAITEFNKKYLMEHCYMPEEKIKVKRINYREHNYDDIKAKTFDHDFIFSAGRLEEMKGYEYTLEAFADIVKNGYQNLKFYIAGRAIEGRYDKIIKEKILELKIENNVVLLGMIENDEVQKYAKGAIFSILTSIELDAGDTEGMPTFFVESMRLSTPCIGSNLSGIPEMIINGETGELVEQRDVESIKQKMYKLLKMYYDDKPAYEKMQSSAKAKAKDLYDNEKNIKILIDTIKGEGI